MAKSSVTSLLVSTNSPFAAARKICTIGFKPPFAAGSTKVRYDEGFSMRATARDFGEGLALVRVDKPPKEEAVGCWVGPMGKA
jgi:hypothetical protein